MIFHNEIKLLNMLFFKTYENNDATPPGQQRDGPEHPRGQAQLDLHRLRPGRRRLHRRGRDQGHRGRPLQVWYGIAWYGMVWFGRHHALPGGAKPKRHVQQIF